MSFGKFFISDVCTIQGAVLPAWLWVDFILGLLLVKILILVSTVYKATSQFSLLVIVWLVDANGL